MLLARTPMSQQQSEPDPRVSLIQASARTGLFGLTSTAKRAAPGNSSCRRPSRLAPSSPPVLVTPVTLASGRLRLATRPTCTGSAAVSKTIGMVVLARSQVQLDGHREWKIHDASWSEGSALSVNYASSEEVDVRLDHPCSGPAKPNI